MMIKFQLYSFYKNLAEEEDGNTEITGTMALLGGFLSLTRWFGHQQNWGLKVA
jgi:hypothetical protein